MINGFYGIFYTGVTGSGVGVLAIKNGIITGVDMGGGIYDGTYTENSTKNLCDAKLKITFPPSATLVTGAMAGSEPLVLNMNLLLPANMGNEQPIPLQTPTGPVNVIFRKIREF